MDNRRDFIKKASALAGGSAILNVFPESIAKAFAIDPAPGTSFLDAEHVVFLMQENRSFDHTYGSLQGVRGFNDPRAMKLPNQNLVWLQNNNAGQTYAPFRLDIKNTRATWMESLPHAWADQVDARNEGRYDKWLESKKSGVKEYSHMPLTLGYYNREDIPFYYSLADAFTVCDQHFCSSLTGTTPNRLFFWTGKIREKNNPESLARVWNEDADYDTNVNWISFPERLEQNGISWKVYQNEIGVGVGFEGEEDAWLSNFGDNPLEYMSQYCVRFSPAYIAHIPKAIDKLSKLIQEEETKLANETTNTAKEESRGKIGEWKKRLDELKQDQITFTPENFNRLSDFEKKIHEKAFVTNQLDADYHQLTEFEYADGATKKNVKVPKGDILHQFRKDVAENTLPAVSWLVAPQNFSDHPSSAWYGAWYISEVMDILTKNPEVWKKTIFILTYDENDGYFDHVPPFVPPFPGRTDTGKCSAGIDTSAEYVTSVNQQSNAEHARISPIGLGYRVPLVIASPWSRGGWVCSEVFDHSSSLQFLEKFLSHKTGKTIHEDNISAWRRTVCGDLSSSFRSYQGETIKKPIYLKRNRFIQSIHQAQFKKEPSNFKSLTKEEITNINKNPRQSSHMPKQERGSRSSCALPYELYVDGSLTNNKESFEINFACGKNSENAKGSAFQVIVPVKHQGSAFKVWNYAVRAGDRVADQWQLADFEKGQYHFKVSGPNGFFREFAGDKSSAGIVVSLKYQPTKNDTRSLTGNLSIVITREGTQKREIEITDNAYGGKKQNIVLDKNEKTLVYDLTKSDRWYDITIRIKGNNQFLARYAGRVETGKPGKTDPAMS